MPKHTCRCGRKRRPSPMSVFQRFRKSAVPPGGWTQENFQSEAGASLVRDMDRMMRAAKARGMRELAPALRDMMRAQIETVLASFERMLANQHGIRRKEWDGKAVLEINAESHGDLWTEAIRRAFDPADAAMVELVTPVMQSVADDVLGKTTLLLGAGDPSAASRRVNQLRVNEIASQVTRVNRTTRDRLARVIAGGIEDGRHPFEVMELVRDRVPGIATYRVPTIVRTEMGRVADAATIRGMRDSEVVTHVSVTGCEAVEPGIPTWNGIPTCNIRNVPLASAGDLRFHINHTGSIVASGFRTQAGTTPDLPPREGGGRGTWEDNGRPVPAIIEDPPGPRPPTVVERPVPRPVPEPPAPVPSVPSSPPSVPDIDDMRVPVRREPGHLRGRIPDMADDDAVQALIDEAVDAYGDSAFVENHARVREFVEQTSLTPKQFLDRATESVRALRTAEGGSGEVSCRLVAVGRGEWSMTARYYAEDGHSRMYFTRIIDTNERKVKHDLFSMDSDLQGSGVGKSVLADLLDVYDHMGLDRIELDANIDVGGYAWARYGFLPRNQAGWEALRTILAEKLDELVEFGRFDPDAFPDSVLDGVATLFESDDPRALRAIAALRLPARGTSPGAPDMPLGKALLLGRYWHGALDLSDPEAYAVFASYIGRTR